MSDSFPDNNRAFVVSTLEVLTHSIRHAIDSELLTPLDDITARMMVTYDEHLKTLRALGFSESATKYLCMKPDSKFNEIDLVNRINSAVTELIKIFEPEIQKSLYTPPMLSELRTESRLSATFMRGNSYMIGDRVYFLRIKITGYVDSRNDFSDAEVWSRWCVSRLDENLDFAYLDSEAKTLLTVRRSDDKSQLLRIESTESPGNIITEMRVDDSSNSLVRMIYYPNLRKILRVSYKDYLIVDVLDKSFTCTQYSTENIYRLTSVEPEYEIICTGLDEVDHASFVAGVTTRIFVLMLVRSGCLSNELHVLVGSELLHRIEIPNTHHYTSYHSIASDGDIIYVNIDVTVYVLVRYKYYTKYTFERAADRIYVHGDYLVREFADSETISASILKRVIIN